MSAARAPEDVRSAHDGLVELCEAQQDTIDTLRRASVAAEQAMAGRIAARRVFAHEVANPLTAVVGILQLLDSGALDGDQARDLVHRAGRQAMALRDLLQAHLSEPEELVALTRTEQEEVRVTELVADAAAATGELLAGHRLECRADPFLTLRTVRGRLQQVLVNLLSNAAKYAPPGTTITVDAGWRAAAVELTVADEGPGVPPHLAEAVFEPFRRGPGSSGVEGHGVGLYVVRRLAESLGGQARLQPRPGGGTIASVFLPQSRWGEGPGAEVVPGAPAGAVTGPAAADPAPAGRRVLVVDDDADTRAVVRRALQREGFAVEDLGSGATAVATAVLRRPSLVVLDLGLPDRDGLEVIEDLRGHSTVPLLVLSGRSGDADRVLALRAGADDFLAKPFTPQELAARAAALLRRARGQAVPEPAGGPLDIDPAARRVAVLGNAVELTRLEFDLLAHLVAHPGRVHQRRDLLVAVWQSAEDWQGPATVTEHVRRLRIKLHAAGAPPNGWIETVRRVGYRFSL